MKKIVPYSLLIALLFPSLLAVAQDPPPLSSSLAKNLWRQCHFYFEEEMDPQATRACGELLAWAEENNELVLVQETAAMVKVLEQRQQPAPATPAAKIQTISELQPDQPLCGYTSIDEAPDHILTKTVTNLPAEFASCTSDSNCTTATGYCGAKISLSKPAQACFEALAAALNQKIGCQSLETPPFQPVCRQQRCTAQF